MLYRAWSLIFCGCIGGCAVAADLPVAPPEELLRVYGQLRALRGSDRWALTENVVWKRDAATFTFVEGRLTFAEPVAGRVLAAVFEGRAAIELNPPTPIAQHQLARFTKSPKLEDTLRHAVFFFTDNSWAELQRRVKVQPGGDAAAASKVLASARVGAILRHRAGVMVSELWCFRRPHSVCPACPFTQEVQVRGHGPPGKVGREERFRGDGVGIRDPLQCRRL